MNRVRFEGFRPGLFQFLLGLVENNNKPWFDEHRREYEAEVLGPVKAFVTELGPIIHMLSEDFETEPRVGRTISRINNDIRFQKNRPPYRPFIYIAFPQRGHKWSNSAVLYVALTPKGVSIGFFPGGHKELLIGPIQQRIRDNTRLFQRYLDERGIAKSYWELAGEGDGPLTKWPLPTSARRWIKLDNFMVGEQFLSTNRAVSRRSFLDKAQQIFLDLYPLWMFATSNDLKADLELYRENAELLARPLTKVASK